LLRGVRGLPGCADRVTVTAFSSGTVVIVTRHSVPVRSP